MGIAAYNRGSALISRQFEDERREKLRREDVRRAVANEEAAMAWVREALGAAAELRQGRGFEARALSRPLGRIGEARMREAVKAQRLWQEQTDIYQRSAAALAYAAAVWRLLEWQITPFRLDVLDNAPAIVRRRTARLALKGGAR